MVSRVAYLRHLGHYNECQTGAMSSIQPSAYVERVEWTLGRLRDQLDCVFLLVATALSPVQMMVCFVVSIFPRLRISFTTPKRRVAMAVMAAETYRSDGKYQAVLLQRPAASTTTMHSSNPTYWLSSECFTKRTGCVKE